jgi:hypothetical protein
MCWPARLSNQAYWSVVKDCSLNKLHLMRIYPDGGGEWTLWLCMFVAS